MSEREEWRRQLRYNSIRVMFKDTDGGEISVGLLCNVRGILMEDGERPISCRWDGRPPILDVNFDRRDVPYLKEWLYGEVLPCLHGDPEYRASKSFEKMVSRIDGLDEPSR